MSKMALKNIFVVHASNAHCVIATIPVKIDFSQTAYLGHPRMSDTPVIEETLKKSKKGAAPSKKSKDKYNGFAVPPLTRPPTRWTRHIYDMISEGAPALLKRDDVKKAYNDLVECLNTYAGQLESWKPAKYARYTSGIKPDNSTYTIFGSLPVRFLNEYDAWNKPDIKKKMQEDAVIIKEKYSVLYELIKRDVVHYMEKKQHENSSRKTLEYYHAMIEKMENDIKKSEAHIEWARKSICEYAQKSLDIAKGPKLTVFDE